MELGADDYITKPFKFDDLLRAVHTAIEKRERLDREAELKLEHLREQIATALPHELRTPLACILGYAEMLVDSRNISSEDVTVLAQQILAAGQRLNRMSENALLYVQVELLRQGRGDVRAQGVPAATPLHEAVARQARDKAKVYARETDLVLDLGAATVRIGRAYVAKIVDELVDNAFKFSPARTPVRVSTAVEASCALLRVSNGGSVMTDEQIAAIGAFVQFERSVREQQGLGLGLSIARGVALLWGGTMSIESRPDTGTTVTVSLPTASPSTTAAADRPVPGAR
jgi:signal transduction histidine kinase